MKIGKVILYNENQESCSPGRLTIQYVCLLII